MIALVIDQGATPGWCLIRAPEHPAEPFTRRAVLEYGTARKPAERRGVVQAALNVSGGPEHLLAAYEDHSKMPLTRGTKHDADGKGQRPNRKTSSILGQGANLGRWLERFDDVGIPKANQRCVPPSEWRTRVLGRGTAKLSREKAKEMAQMWATALLGGLQVSHDTAESMAIAAYVFVEWLAKMGGRT